MDFFNKYSIDKTFIEVFYARDSIMDMKHYEYIKKYPIVFHLYPEGKHTLIKVLKEKEILNHLLDNI